MGLTFFNKPSYKKFDLNPRYYDAQKSELERRRGQWDKTKDDKSHEYNRDEFEAELKFRWPSQRQSKSSFNLKYTNRKRTFILLAIMSLIIMIIYFIGKKYSV